jgi:D-alanine-D-alanine ligase
MTIALLYGGKSSEHEISLRSAASVGRELEKAGYSLILIGIARDGTWYAQGDEAVAALRSGAASLPLFEPEAARVSIVPNQGIFIGAKRVDAGFVFPVLHGTFGEDGTVQGLLECAGLPYAGAGVIGSAIGMDKECQKRLWCREGIPTLPFELIDASSMKGASRDVVLDRAERSFGYPLFVKPSCSGSSVGTAKASDRPSLERAVDGALQVGSKVLVEPFLSARELECSVIGNESPKAYGPGEIVSSHEFYDYDAKYLDPDGAALLVPAPLAPELAQKVRALAISAYKTVLCEGFARVDLFLSKSDGSVYVNEINTIPGFTSSSMFPLMCMHDGLSYADTLCHIIELGMERHRNAMSLRYTRQ